MSLNSYPDITAANFFPTGNKRGNIRLILKSCHAHFDKMSLNYCQLSAYPNHISVNLKATKVELKISVLNVLNIKNKL